MSAMSGAQSLILSRGILLHPIGSIHDIKQDESRRGGRSAWDLSMASKNKGRLSGSMNRNSCTRALNEVDI